jgi:uncharacterized protein YkwD
MRCVISEVRAQAGLPRLRVSQKLDAAASIKATAIRRCGFTHTPCGQPWALPLQRVGYLRRASMVGENLAWGQSEQGSPLQVVTEWLASPPHRRNLLDRSYREAGLALQRGSMFGDGDVTLWVLEFGRRR